MNAMTGDAVAQRLDGIVYEKKQRHPRSFDLTVGSISRVEGPGALDFGGSELEAAPLELLEVEKRSPEDDYGWWNLAEGRYRVRYNEQIVQDGEFVGFVQPHRRLLAAGADHAQVLVTPDHDTIESLLNVGEHGLRIKENARISTLVMLAS